MHHTQPIEPLMPWQLGPGYPRWTETLRDHSQVVIRPIRAQDAVAERTFIESLSPQARRYRFLGEVHHPSSELIERLTRLDYVHDLAFAAVVPDGARDKFVGISRYSTSSDGTACECAVTVLDDWQNKGLGAILMKHLIEVAAPNVLTYDFRSAIVQARSDAPSWRSRPSTSVWRMPSTGLASSVMP